MDGYSFLPDGGSWVLNYVCYYKTHSTSVTQTNKPGPFNKQGIGQIGVGSELFSLIVNNDDIFWRIKWQVSYMEYLIVYEKMMSIFEIIRKLLDKYRIIRISFIVWILVR